MEGELASLVNQRKESVLRFKKMVDDYDDMGREIFNMEEKIRRQKNATNGGHKVNLATRILDEHHEEFLSACHKLKAVVETMFQLVRQQEVVHSTNATEAVHNTDATEAAYNTDATEAAHNTNAAESASVSAENSELSDMDSDSLTARLLKEHSRARDGPEETEENNVSRKKKQWSKKWLRPGSWVNLIKKKMSE